MDVGTRKGDGRSYTRYIINPYIVDGKVGHHAVANTSQGSH